VIAVRPAAEGDVRAMSEVLTASIRELCAADHRGDPEIIARWTQNKTPEAVGKMLANPTLRMFVAELDGRVAAVGAVTTAGEVALNYVAPAFRFRGASKALLAAMETDIHAAGLEEGRLTSTETARRFYASSGWEDSGPRDDDGFVTGYPMRKRL
jgi:GNAT superfamily N-acetyltransferase